MSAGELAGIVEGWATLVGLIVVALGAAFAGQQLRQESRPRRLQALVALYADVWPIEAARASQTLSSLPDDFDYAQLGADQRGAVGEVVHRYNRLGYLLRLGLVRDEDLFRFYPFGSLVITSWEKLKRFVRTGGGISTIGHGTLPGEGLYFEFLAARAQRYVLEHGDVEFGGLPTFDPDLEAVKGMSESIQRERTAAG